MKAELVFENADIEVWDKPSGWSTHNEPPSLQEFLTQRSSGPLHFLNRLDAETSGLVVLVKKAERVSFYQDIWQQAGTRKIYWGLHRRPRDFKMQPQDWHWPLSDKSDGYKNPQGLAKDRVACSTHFVPISETRHLIFSALILETGRQHQIRKHSCVAGCELIGDKRYGEAAYNRKLSAHIPDLRLGLHCAALVWTVPDSPQILSTKAPPFFEKLIPDAGRKFEDFMRTLLHSL